MKVSAKQLPAEVLLQMSPDVKTFFEIFLHSSKICFTLPFKVLFQAMKSQTTYLKGTKTQIAIS